MNEHTAETVQGCGCYLLVALVVVCFFAPAIIREWVH